MCEKIIVKKRMALKIFELENILKKTSGVQNKNFEIRCFSTDSRKIERGDVFVAIKGERTDGHMYIDNAFERGAVLAISEKKLGDRVLTVHNCIESLGTLARSFIDKNNFKIIGITGSIGKTTAKDVIVSVLKTEFNVSGSIGNMNTEIGLPLSILNADDNSDFLVLEMGARHRGDINYLCSIAPLEIAVITYIAPVHLEIFKSMDEILESKKEIIDNLPENGIAVLNGDDRRLNELGKTLHVNIVYYGLASQNVTTYQFSKKGTMISFQDYDVFIPILGKSGLYAALAAIAVGEIAGVSKENIRNGLAAAQNPHGRLNLIKLGDINIIDDSYNSNPVALTNSLELTQIFKHSRLICVLGDMKELGDQSAYYHLLSGIEVANLEFAFLIAVGEMSMYFKEGALKGGMEERKIFEVQDWKEAEKILRELLLPNDIVLIKGSRTLELDKIIDKLKEVF